MATTKATSPVNTTAPTAEQRLREIGSLLARQAQEGHDIACQIDCAAAALLQLEELLRPNQALRMSAPMSVLRQCIARSTQLSDQLRGMAYSTER